MNYRIVQAVGIDTIARRVDEIAKGGAVLAQPILFEQVTLHSHFETKATMVFQMEDKFSTLIAATVSAVRCEKCGYEGVSQAESDARFRETFRLLFKEWY